MCNILQVEMNDRLDRLFEFSASHTSRAAHAETEAGRDFAELSGNHDALRQIQHCCSPNTLETGYKVTI